MEDWNCQHLSVTCMWLWTHPAFVIYLYILCQVQGHLRGFVDTLPKKEIRNIILASDNLCNHFSKQEEEEEEEEEECHFFQLRISNFRFPQPLKTFLRHYVFLASHQVDRHHHCLALVETFLWGDFLLLWFLSRKQSIGNWKSDF